MGSAPVLCFSNAFQVHLYYPDFAFPGAPLQPLAIKPWEFVVTSDKKILKKICDMCPNGPFIKDVSHLAAVFSKDTRYYIEDCSAATQNMLLAIEALGLGGCWVAGDKKNYAEDIRKIFNAPDGYKLVSMITIGYPKKEETPHAKRNLKDVLRWERYA